MNFLSSFTLPNGVQLKNRIVMAPMTTMSSFYDGHITDDEVNYYRQRAGGPAMIITAVAYISELGKGFEGQLSAACDEFIPDLARIANAIKIDGTKAILQIFHAGRMSNSRVLRGKQTVAPSAVSAERPNAQVPIELLETEILTIIDDFAAATVRAIKAGFDGVELHGANTYLLQQFFSPHSNRRNDSWGGTLSKRMRLPLAVIAKVKQAIAQHATTPFILGYRLSPEEIETTGIRIADTLSFIEQLKTVDLDYLHISSGNVWRTSLNDKTDLEPIIKKIQKIVGNNLPIIAVGGVERPEDAQKVIAEGIQLVAIGRQLIREPHWVQKASNNDTASIRYTISPADYAQLAIPTAMWYFLLQSFRKEIYLSTDKKADSEKIYLLVEG